MNNEKFSEAQQLHKAMKANVKEQQKLSETVYWEVVECSESLGVVALFDKFKKDALYVLQVEYQQMQERFEAL